VNQAISKIQAACQELTLIFGVPQAADGKLYNAAAILQAGKAAQFYYKQCLPNYSVFDEYRYFTAGNEPCVINVEGVKLGILVCEDGWHEHPARLAKQAGAEILLQLNASPYYQGKLPVRLATARERIAEVGLPLLSVYLVGGQDEIIFDGYSFVCNADGSLAVQLPAFTEQLAAVSFQRQGNGWCAQSLPIPQAPSTEAELYQALVLALRDYVNKNGFKQVVLGLSGGIDSALTLAIAVDALGKDRVEAVLMPSRYTSELSNREALQQIACMGVKHQIIAIEPIVDSLLHQLAPSFAGCASDLTEENLQARCRGILLMALSNKFGKLVLITSNKSELAVGYSTLYGDMAGGFGVLKDVWKTTVYRLAHYRNSLSPVIPLAVIERAPSAELRDNQTDQDSLPPYEILDAILQHYIEQNWSAADIIAKGYAAEAVNKVIQLVKRNQYKRQQAPLGPKVTSRSLGRDWRYPVTARF
jgi:NAD+ synthetase